MKPVWTTTRRDLQKIFQYNGFEVECVWDKPELPKDACWVYGLALPYYLNLKVEDFNERNAKYGSPQTVPDYDTAYARALQCTYPKDKRIGIDFVELGWKTKWSATDIRFECTQSVCTNHLSLSYPVVFSQPLQ